jgi:predicted transcriptional regulator
MVSLIKESYTPNAYLQRIKNVKSGLTARTKILASLDKKVAVATSLSKETSQSYSAVIHHLRLMESDGTIRRRGKKPYIWEKTGLGQKQLGC